VDVLVQGGEKRSGRENSGRIERGRETARDIGHFRRKLIRSDKESASIRGDRGLKTSIREAEEGEKREKVLISGGDVAKVSQA